MLPALVVCCLGHSSITFNGKVGRSARLTATCEAEAPTIVYLAPNDFSGPDIHDALMEDGVNVMLQLGMVEPDCGMVPSAKVPCASAGSPIAPPLFYCHFEGAGEPAIVGPVHARLAANAAGYNMVALNCSADYSALTAAGGYEHDGASFELRVSVTHFAAKGDEATALTWAGVPDGNLLSFAGFRAPAPPPPPMQPSAVSCQAWHDRGYYESGYYDIGVGSNVLSLYCDMQHEGGGWTRVARGISSDTSGWLTAGALNINEDGSPVSEGSYKLADATINALPKSSYWVTGGNERFMGNWYWESGCTYAHTSVASGKCVEATFHDPTGKANKCPSGSHSGHFGLTGWASSPGNMGGLHSAHDSNFWYIKHDSCNHGSEGTGYCRANNYVADTSYCNLEIYVGGFATLPSSLPAQPSCQHHRKNGATSSGYYAIQVDGNVLSLYCDMQHEGGGWTRVARGISSDTSGWLTAGALNINEDGSPVSEGSYKLADATINALPKSSYWVTGGNERFMGNWYWESGCTYAHTSVASGKCVEATFHDPTGKANKCPSGSHSGHFGLTGWASSPGNMGGLHSAHDSNFWYIKHDSCNHGSEGTGYCRANNYVADTSYCNLEIYVR